MVFQLIMINFAHLNVRSLLPKVHLLKVLSADLKLDILTISETWINENTSLDDVKIKGYTFLKRDRFGRDHDMVFCTLAIQGSKKLKFVHSYRNSKAIDIDSFQNDLRLIPFQNIFTLNNINDKIDFLNIYITRLFDEHAPVTHKAKARYRKTKLIGHWNYYKELRNFATNAIQNEKKAYFNYVSARSNNRELWEKLKHLGIGSNEQVQIPSTLSSVNEINDYFVNCIPVIDNTNAPEPLRFNDEGTDIKLTFNAVNCDIVNKLIGDITSNATGYDKINIKMIKLCCPYILPYITHILNHCIVHSTYPSQCKHAIIKPIPKVKKSH
ncbi:hypothetical protein ILUMI_18075 [Ignelater luminosus]|uniref:Uncharacterized protein n=1 Tax=Ignelater luminosus TaxID=2038154 RepID=A0A8K0CIP8_IGNLU|nr:hypothetical protein ILUMI_18075 [Ignelater luminosus]